MMPHDRSEHGASPRIGYGMHLGGTPAHLAFTEVAPAAQALLRSHLGDSPSRIGEVA